MGFTEYEEHRKSVNEKLQRYNSMQEKIDTLEKDMAAIKGQMELISYTLSSIDKTLIKFEENITEVSKIKTEQVILSRDVKNLQYEVFERVIPDIKSNTHKIAEAQSDSKVNSNSITNSDKIMFGILAAIMSIATYFIKQGNG